MFLTRNEYDYGVNTFSPEGRLFQVEYANEAIKLGTTVLGIHTSEGVILAAEKRIGSPLLVPSSVEKIAKIDSHIGCAMSGLTSDAITIIEHARVESQYHRFTYDEPMSVEACTQSICDLALRFGEYDREERGMSRPFGVALLIGGVYDNEPYLFSADPSGTFVRHDAMAVGAAAEGAEASLQDEYHKSISLEEAETLALSILKQVMEDKVNSLNVDIAAIPLSTSAYRSYSVNEIQNILDRL